MLIDISQLKFSKDVYGVIHIGAHDCEERIKYLLHFHSVTDNEIIWIDALKNKVNKIKIDNPTIRIFNECISNIDNETVMFNVTNNLQSSSILNLKEHLIEHPDIFEIEKIEMKTKTLKTFYDENNFKYNQFNFMNLDIQGAELLALEGAKVILNYIDYIYIEVNNKELYENCPLLDDIDKYLNKFHFKRQQIYMTEHGWGDAFYVKNIFDITNNFIIEYGFDNIKTNIIDDVFKKSNDFGMWYIPPGDEARAALFGDPLYGTLKQIFITDENNKYIIEHDSFAYIDTLDNKLYINEKKKYNHLSILSIFKNETMNLKVWLDHYLWQGVEHFYLIDNDSNDNPLNILQEYINNGIVTYYFRPEKYQQSNHYRYVFDNEKLKEKTKWLCICDLDEFFFGTEKKLAETINEFNNFDVIYTNSYFYGSDNLIDHPIDIRTSIIHRQEDIENGIKYIFKPSVIKDSSEIWIHWLVHSGSLQKKILSTETFDNTKIRLNHYSIQSLEYFKNIKMTRGDVSVIENEHIRDLKYFEHYSNISTIKDDILKQIIEQNIYNQNGEIMKFYDENNNIIDNNNIEKQEQDLANEYILEDDIVLELGARYGTVSCIINKKIKNKLNQVSVEPDNTVWNSLELNKIKNNCNFNIVKGFVSNKKLGLYLSGYGSTFIPDEETTIPSYSLPEIQRMYNIKKFNVLVADCEGFLEVFFDENPTLYDDLRLFIFEADMAEKCNYDKIKQNLLNNNFIKIIEGPQNVWIKKNN
jgi:FkbM family methyltransferase